MYKKNKLSKFKRNVIFINNILELNRYNLKYGSITFLFFFME